MTMRPPFPILASLALLLALTTRTHAQSGPPLDIPAPAPPPVPAPGSPGDPIGLQQALRDFPPLIIVNNVHATTTPGTPIPPSCPKAGSRVEQKGGPTLEFLGTVEGKPDLCHMRVDGAEFDSWYGIWATTWPGADFAYRALQRVLHSKTGDVVGFDTVGEPGVAAWHDLIRHDGIEDIRLLDKTYTALKLSHYREGFAGNTYRSNSTLWIDIASGLPIYATYQHISGKPELDGALVPTAILPAP